MNERVDVNRVTVIVVVQRQKQLYRNTAALLLDSDKHFVLLAGSQQHQSAFNQVLL